MSERNPYWWAYRRRRAHRREQDGPLRGLLGSLMPLFVAATLVPVVRPVFLRFLDQGDDALAAGVQGIVLRLGFLVVGAMALDVYAALIRSDERAILDLHPVDPGLVARFMTGRTALERWWVPVATAILLLPIAVEASVLAWAAASLALACVWVLALSASAVMHLGAVWMSEAPSMEPLLDMLRGSNPRAQAAFLYAPGAVLGATGGLVWLASVGVARLILGDVALAALIAVPLLVGAVLTVPIHRLAARTWFRASPVLADIDARYSALEQDDDANRVYLEFAVRWLPESVGRYVLKDLRHGWRVRRTAITLTWGVGIAAAMTAWSGAPTAVVTSMVVSVLGVFALALNGILMERDQPAFLREWLAVDATAALLARAIAVFAWLQVAVWLPLPVVWLRHGLGAALVTAGIALVCSIVAAGLVAVCSRRPNIGLWIYLPVVAGIAVAVVTATRLGGVL